MLREINYREKIFQRSSLRKHSFVNSEIKILEFHIFNDRSFFFFIILYQRNCRIDATENILSKKFYFLSKRYSKDYMNKIIKYIYIRIRIGYIMCENIINYIDEHCYATLQSIDDR